MSKREMLLDIGFTKKESDVYLALLSNGRVTPSDLAKICKITRPTIYNIANSLIKKGVIAEDLGGKTLYLTPLPISNLNQIVEIPRRELKAKESLVKKAIASLSILTSEKKYPIPKIQFIEEDKLENFLYTNTSKWNNELPKVDNTWWGFQDHSLVENYEKWILWFSKQKEYQPKQFKTKLLSNISPIEQKMGSKLTRTKRDIRFLSGMNFTSSVWVTGDYLIMIMTRNHPFYLVEIHDSLLAHNMREVFKKLWSLTEIE